MVKTKKSVDAAARPSSSSDDSNQNTSKRKSKTPVKKRKTQRVVFEVYPGRQHAVSKKVWNEIKHLQMTTFNCIPKAPFARLVREIMQNTVEGRQDFRIQMEALAALHDATEYYITTLFEHSNLCARHAKRVTLAPKDMQLVLQLKGPTDPGFP
ncbi:unnamed protein product [Brassicogethes aeneus]|uniref:Core Histone H2A/H2B/H3 domain-containing protein n=1 Tax=Brassicogethes aeneus TaxID=1431903 RepID=A0A9P0FJ07_BRAAE|nr:unnamed protein product [Brassicogethes aeneus]